MRPRIAPARIVPALLAAALLAGCASAPRPGESATESAAENTAETAAARSQWQGRLALTVHSEPPQAWSASFTLSGDAQTGRLQLLSPLGNTLALMHWQPGQAVLEQGGQTQRYPSLAEMTAHTTGAPVPVAALFDWLRGQPHPGAAGDWHVDLSGIRQGRLQAQRLQPLPTASLRVVFEP